MVMLCGARRLEARRPCEVPEPKIMSSSVDPFFQVALGLWDVESGAYWRSYGRLTDDHEVEDLLVEFAQVAVRAHNILTP